MNQLGYQLKQLVKLMDESAPNYAIVGGIAVSVYGLPRLTYDIDVNIILDNSQLSGFLKKARKFGFRPLPANINKFVKSTGVIPMEFSKNKINGRCDIIIAQNILEYLCIRRARIKKIYSVNVKLITPEDLIIHKIISSRPRDLEDARGIFIRQKGKLDIKYITAWLKKIAEVNRKPELLTLFRTMLKS